VEGRARCQASSLFLFNNRGIHCGRRSTKVVCCRSPSSDRPRFIVVRDQTYPREFPRRGLLLPRAPAEVCPPPPLSSCLMEDLVEPFVGGSLANTSISLSEDSITILRYNKTWFAQTCPSRQCNAIIISTACFSDYFSLSAGSHKHSPCLCPQRIMIDNHPLLLIPILPFFTRSRSNPTSQQLC
jgi:hypothetical protein